MKHLYTTVLSIAGSDNSAGAGVQADIKTGMLADVYVMTAITAVTAQNSTTVDVIEPVTPEILRRQIESIADDITIDAVKIGMIPTAESVEVIADCIDKFGLERIVLDPVGCPTLSKTCSQQMLEASVARKELLFNRSTVVTPNLDETEWIIGERVDRDNYVESMAMTAEMITKLTGCRATLIKGGHGAGQTVTDVLHDAKDGTTQIYLADKIETRNSHGTGCCLSTAIACGLARRRGLLRCVSEAEKMVHALLESGRCYEFGKGGYGPLGFLNY